MELKTKSEALTLALVLAITATDDDRVAEALDHAMAIANSGMTLQQVEDAKKAAQALAEIA
jgi:Skp family chaperone for outer membrane proteins